MDVNAPDQFLRRQPCFWLIIKLLAGDDMDVHPSSRQVEGEIAQELTCGAMIGEKVAIEEEYALHGAYAMLSESRAGLNNALQPGLQR
jgi:hypothetical protein